MDSEPSRTIWRPIIGNLLMLFGGVAGVFTLTNLPDGDAAYSAGYAAGGIVAALLLVWWGWRLRRRSGRSTH